MRPKTYKDLVFWQKSFDVAISVVKIFKKLPHSVDINIIINQLLRSVMSIGANIAEGYGRYGNKEYRRYLQVALGSANETEYWLMLLIECDTNLDTEINHIIEKNTEVIKMLASSIKTLKFKNPKLH